MSDRGSRRTGAEAQPAPDVTQVVDVFAWYAATTDLRPRADLTDRILSRVAQEPRQTPARRFLVALLALRLERALAALRLAAAAAVGKGQYPLLVRGQALALVLLVVLSLGAMGAAGAAGLDALLRQPTGPTPPPAVVVPSPSLIEPSPGPEESDPGDLQASQAPEPTEGTVLPPKPTAEPRATPRPTKKPTARPPEPTPRPTKTPKPPKPTPHPTRTPRPTEHPEPTEPPEPTDDHGDGDGGGDGPAPTDPPDGQGGEGASDVVLAIGPVLLVMTF